jgi:cell division protein FtsW
MSAVERRAQAVSKNAALRAARVFPDYDGWLLGSLVALISIGLVMVASTSITMADRQFGEPLYYFWRQLTAIVLGFAGTMAVMKIPLRFWQRSSTVMLFVAIGLVLLVLVPGLGREVNGSMRWLGFGPVSLQASEPAKLCMIIYLAGYLVRHGPEVRRAFSGFIKPIGVLTVVAGLLLLEPDYGATVVMFGTCLGLLFLGGVSWTRFLAWGLVAISALAALVTVAPYRMERLMTFVDPWSDPFNSGFQLTQALIAFGRGELFGVGLGGSVQKLFYLPEAHTDFIFAVLAEETGFLGVLAVVLIFAFVIWRAFYIGQLAALEGQDFANYLASGIGLSIGVQAFMNIGVNLGVLPTKGLTLPLISYGSNSVLVTCIAFGLLLRIEHELRRRSKTLSEQNAYG